MLFFICLNWNLFCLALPGPVLVYMMKNFQQGIEQFEWIIDNPPTATTHNHVTASFEIQAPPNTKATYHTSLNLRNPKTKIHKIPSSLSFKIKPAMETILIDCVHNSLRHFMYRNAIFLCERLCAEFPMEVLLPSSSSLLFMLKCAKLVFLNLKGKQN